MNTLQWNLNTKAFFHEITVEDVAWKISAILFRPQCVNETPGIVLSRIMKS